MKIKAVSFLVVLMVFILALPFSFAQPPGIGPALHPREHMEDDQKAMVEQGEQALERAKRAASAILPNEIQDNSKAMIEHANVMIDKTEQFIVRIQKAMDARDAPRNIREHGIEAVKKAREAIQNQKEAIKHAEAAIRSQFNVIDAKNNARKSKENAEVALRDARAAKEHADLFLPGPPPGRR